ncbi:hypothetical protein KJ781_04005 [Patescibacteria group bacterium]|nr:hypothetical protein [Patescibacteria group bacterium]MBU1448477.1 hypothetical protein [Patescibacteria group bacterium]MBU2613543.1 hypothetical protein [Patescibacteria group bacterium]
MTDDSHRTVSHDLNQRRTEPLTQSLFPCTRELLNDSAFLASLEHVAPADVLKTYVDPVDFLFCEIKTSYRVVCERFYAQKCAALCALPICTPERIRRWDTLLMGALLLADEFRRQGKSLPWDQFRQLVFQTADGVNL